MTKSSIIVPTLGRNHSIKATIQSLLALSPEKSQAEILIIDNNTSAELSEELKEYCLQYKNHLRYIRETSLGATAARHRGALEARGDLLSFIDDDVEVSPGWLKAIQQQFLDPQVSIVGGPSIPKITSSIPPWLFGFITATPYGGWKCNWLSLLDIGHNVPSIDPTFIWGLNLSIRKSVFMDCGGFWPDYIPKPFEAWQGSGDTGLTYTASIRGYRADYVQDALVIHWCGSERMNSEYFTRKAFFFGIGGSYVQLRKRKKTNEMSLVKAIKKILRPIHRLYKNLFVNNYLVKPFWVRDFSKIQLLTLKAYRAGWKFHREEFNRNENLREWIRRENYLDTDIHKLSNSPLRSLKFDYNE